MRVRRAKRSDAHRAIPRVSGDWRPQLKALSWLLGADVVARVIGQMAIVATARILGAESYGRLGAALAIFSIMIAMADLGAGDAAVQHLTGRAGGAAMFRDEVGPLRLVSVVPILPICVLALIFATDPTTKVIAALLTALPFAILTNGRALEARIAGRFSSAAKWTLALLLGQWCGALAGSLYSTSAISSAVGIVCLLSLPAIATVRRASLRLPSLRVSKLWLRRGLPFFVTAGAVVLYSRGDRVVVTIIAGAGAGGIYAAAYSIVMLAAIAGASLQAAMLPRLIHEHDNAIPSRWVSRSFVLVCTLAPFAIALWATAPWFMSLLYGDAFRGAGTILRILCPLVLLYVLNPFLSSYLISMRQQRYLARVAVANLAVASVGYPVLTLALGAAGTAYASVLIECCGAALIIFRLRLNLSNRGEPYAFGS